MNKRITFRGMDHSDNIEGYANEQLERIVTFLENEPTPIHIDLVLESGKPHAHHKVELRVKSPHYNLISSYEAQELYPVLERVCDNMYEQLREKKRELVASRKTTDKYK